MSLNRRYHARIVFLRLSKYIKVNQHFHNISHYIKSFSKSHQITANAKVSLSHLSSILCVCLAPIKCKPTHICSNSLLSLHFLGYNEKLLGDRVCALCVCFCVRVFPAWLVYIFRRPQRSDIGVSFFNHHKSSNCSAHKTRYKPRVWVAPSISFYTTKLTFFRTCSVAPSPRQATYHICITI